MMKPKWCSKISWDHVYPDHVSMFDRSRWGFGRTKRDAAMSWRRNGFEATLNTVPIYSTFILGSKIPIKCESNVFEVLGTVFVFFFSSSLCTKLNNASEDVWLDITILVAFYLVFIWCFISELFFSLTVILLYCCNFVRQRVCQHEMCSVQLFLSTHCDVKYVHELNCTRATVFEQ